MARLETQVNQIYLLGPETKSISIILYDEKIGSRLHLFLLAELKDIQRKTEAQNLKKISEVILNAFRSNKKLPLDSLFESSLAEINENLAEMAHKGRKSWLGKFSCGILLKGNDQIYLANTGQVSAWLRRNSELSELLGAEESRGNPLKTFENFTQGKLAQADDLILTGSSMFNFVSLELFKNTLRNLSIDQACLNISKILQDSVNQDEGVGAFMLNFNKKANQGPVQDYSEEIYAPLPESLEQSSKPKKTPLDKFFTLPKKLFFNFSYFFSQIKLPKLSIIKSLSPSGKFFLSSFLLFLILLSLSLTVSAVRSNKSKQTEKIQTQIDILVTSINETESALIYNNQNQALENLRTSYDEFATLTEIDKKTAQTYESILTDLNNKVNRVSVIEDPEILTSFDQIPDLMTKAGSGFVFVKSNESSVQNFNQDLQGLFMLNNPNDNVVGLTHVEGLGNYITTKNALYRINEAFSQFDKIRDFPDSDLLSLKFLTPNRGYSIDKNQNQVIRTIFNNDGSTDVELSLKTVVDLNQAVDLAVGSDIFILYPDRISKFSRGIEQGFELSSPTNPIENANKLFVGNNLYILESEKKSLVIFDRQGNLVNQIYFPSSKNLKDLHVDELERSIYLLDHNKLIKITF
jgi:hypothetical protein